MKPLEGRARVVIEEIQPTVDCGRYPAKRTLGDPVEVTAAIFGDGHDHIAARLLFRHAAQRKWQTAPFTPLTNDLWTAAFTPDKLGSWRFTIEAWVDHFDTWVADLAKRLAAQPAPPESTTATGAPAAGAPSSATASSSPQVDSPPAALPLASETQTAALIAHQPTQQQTTAQDIPLALRIGAGHIDSAASRAKGTSAHTLAAAAHKLRALADLNLPFYQDPIDADLIALVAMYPDLTYATRHSTDLPLWVDRERARFSAWYELFPRSASPTPGAHGTFRDVEARLPEIAAMGFDVVYMPPIHPIGTAFRKGRNNAVSAVPGDVGSPWAIGASTGGHTAILPELGSLDDFDSLTAAARSHSMELALDIAFQCSPDHPWVAAHPEWFTHRPDGTIQYAENPPKKYQDIYPLNFESTDWRGLWDALHDVFQFWIGHGVRIFRVDNPHTKALLFWQWCIAEIQKTAPDTLFLAEAFTRPHVMYSLAKAGFTQSYTYFTWRTTKPELQTYFEELTTPPVSDFFRPNLWPNTPDILHEQFQVADQPQLPDPKAPRRAIFQQRVILAATLSANYGLYGPAYELLEGRAAPPAPGKTGSEEYLDSEKYQLRAWDRSSPDSIAPLLTQLNRIRHENPALQRNENLHFHACENAQILCYSKTTKEPSSTTQKPSPERTTSDGSARFTPENTILVAINLDPLNQQSTWLNIALDHLNLPWDSSFALEDLLTGTHYTWHGQWNYVALTPQATAHIFRILPQI
jgi:starch synthase (maltosyl-transferring)